MPRLNHVTRRLTTAPKRLQTVSMHDMRDQANEWRGWYKTKRWRDLRQSILIRDRFTCQQTGIVCTAPYPHDFSAVVDHIKPHRGNSALFWDVSNLQTVSKVYHDTKKRSEEAGGIWDKPVKAPGTKYEFSIPHGVKPSAVPVNLIVGPPAAGKTTFAYSHASSIDVVIDLDDIRRRVGGVDWDQSQSVNARAFAYRDRMIRNLAKRKRGKAWLIVMAPTQAERQAWARHLGSVNVIEIDPGPDVCKARIASDHRRASTSHLQIAAVDRWYDDRGGGAEMSRGDR